MVVAMSLQYYSHHTSCKKFHKENVTYCHLNMWLTLLYIIYRQLPGYFCASRNLTHHEFCHLANCLAQCIATVHMYYIKL